MSITRDKAEQEALVLQYLKEKPFGMRAQLTIACALDTTETTCRGILKRLEGKGLVRKGARAGWGAQWEVICPPDPENAQ